MVVATHHTAVDVLCFSDDLMSLPKVYLVVLEQPSWRSKAKTSLQHGSGEDLENFVIVNVPHSAMNFHRIQIL
jgi:hypothetical protein